MAARVRAPAQLNGDWVRRKIGPMLRGVGQANLAIFENPPMLDNERGVELLLFVDW